MNRLETIDANLAKCIMKAKEPQINLIVERVCEQTVMQGALPEGYRIPH